jgi:spermidine/putrescine transport system substrate-binding protein
MIVAAGIPPTAIREVRMTKKTLTSAQATMRAAMLSRRKVLQSATAIGAVGLAAPFFSRNAFSSSGELNLLMWSDEFPGSDVIPEFRKGHRHQGEPDAVLAERRADQQAAGNRRRRLRPLPADPQPRAAVQGSRRSGALRHQQDQELRQRHPVDPGELADLWTWEDGLYYLPHVWGSEALSYRTDLYQGRCDQAQLRLAVG